MIFWIICLIVIIFLFLWVLCWLCDMCDKGNAKRAEKKNDELIRICTECDVDKLRSLLKKGLDPNTKVKRVDWVYGDYDSAVPVYYDEPLIEVAKYNKPIQDLLVAYGALTRGDFKSK